MTPPPEGPRPLSVWTDGTDFVIAHDEEDADKAWEELIGDPRSKSFMGHAPDPWERRPDAEPLTVIDPDEYDADGERRKETKTCAEWIASNGRGWLCSTEW